MINGELIRKRRIELGISQAELAEKCGYSDKSAICHLEKGEIDDLPLTKAVLLSRALKILPTQLAK